MQVTGSTYEFVRSAYSIRRKIAASEHQNWNLTITIPMHYCYTSFVCYWGDCL